MTPGKRHRPYQIVSIILIAIIIVAGLIYIFNKPKPVEAEWWNDGWHYREKITITENYGLAVNNYPLSTTLSSLGDKAQDDCDDLRVTDVSGNVLSSQLETCNTSGDSIIWWQSDFVAGEVKIFYIYYGNLSVSAPNFSTIDQNLYAEVNPAGDHTFWLKNSQTQLGGDNDNSSGSIRQVIDVASGKNGGSGAGGARVDYHYESSLGGDADGVIGSAAVLADGVVFKSISWSEYEDGFTVERQAWLFANYPVVIQRYRITNNSGGSYTFSSGHHSMTESALCYVGGDGSCASVDGDTWGGSGSSYGWFLDHTGIGMCKIRSSNIVVGGTWRSSGSPSSSLTLGSGVTSGWYEYYLVPITSSSICVNYGNWQYVSKPSSSISSEEKGPGPVAYWKFDEGYGTTAYDSTTNSNNGTISGAIWQTENMCVSGECLYYNGSSSISRADSDSLDFNGSFSISGWVRLTNTPGSAYSALVQKIGGLTCNVGNPNGYFIGFSDTKKVRWRLMSNSGAACGTYDSNAVLNLNQWYYLSIVFDNSATSVILYIDGNQDNSWTWANSWDFTNSQTLQIGPNVKGFLDEIKIYPYARTAAQVKADYLAGQSGSLSGASVSFGGGQQNQGEGLVGYWKMDDNVSGASQAIVDSSGNLNNGTTVGDSTNCVVAGKYGTGCNFDGTDDYFTINNSDVLEYSGNEPFTYSIWLYKDGDSDDGYGTIISKSSNSENQKQMMVEESTNKLQAHIDWGAESTAEYVINDNTWYYATMVYDGTDLFLYVDGILRDTADVQPAGNVLSNSSNIALGTLSYSLGGYSFNGTLDDFKFYNTALTPDQVMREYKTGPPPIAYWDFEDLGQTTYAYDKSGNEKKATLQGSPSWDLGKLGTALGLNGSNQYATVSSDDTLFSIATDRRQSFSFWMRADSYAAKQVILSRRHPCNNDGHFRINVSSNDLYFVFYATEVSSAISYYTNDDVLTDGQWHHVEWTKEWDKASATKVYLDGVEQTVYNGGGDSAAGSAYTGLPIYIGAQNGGTGCNGPLESYFNGEIDDVKIYNYIRTPEQVLWDMYGDETPHPVAYWKFDEGYGTTTGDLAGNGNIVTLENGANWDSGGKFSNAVEFDGADSSSGQRAYVADSDDVDFKSGDSFSTSFWINRHSNVTDYIFCKNGSWGISAYSSSIKTGLWGCGNTDDPTVSYTLPTNEWTHVVTVYNDINHEMFLYINGEFVGSDIGNDCLGSYSSSVLYLGYMPWTGYYVLDGLLDEVKLFDFALSPEQVKQEYNHSGGVKLTSSRNTDSTWDDGGFGGDAPVGYWNFEEGSGTTLYDRSANSNNGVITNATYTLGKPGWGLDFDGDDYVTLTSEPFSASNADYTIELWAKWDDIPTTEHRRYISWGDASGRYFYGYNYSSQKIDVGHGTITITPTSSLYKPTAGVWQHWSVTNSGTTTKFYLDGRLISTETHAATNAVSTGSPVRIGRQYNNGLEYFKGSIDEVKIFNYARSQAQIAYDYNGGTPVGWWKFDDKEGVTAIDISGNSNNGTLTNMDPASDWVDGEYGGALDFDGSNDYVCNDYDGDGSCESGGNDDNPVFDITGDLTLAAWVYPGSAVAASSEHSIVGKIDDWNSARAYNLEGRGNGSLVDFRVWSGTDTGGSACGSGYLYSAGQWYHVAGVFDTSSGNYKIYVNGVLTNTCSSWTANSNTTAPLRVGSVGGSSRFWHGKIDDVRIYNYALTADQIKEVMNYGSVYLK